MTNTFAAQPVFKASLAENEIKATLMRFWTFMEVRNPVADDYANLFTSGPGLSVQNTRYNRPPVTSRKELRERLLAMPPEQKNAHWLRSLTITKESPKAISFTAKVFYKMLAPDGTPGAADIDYEGTFLRRQDGIPLIQHLKIMPKPINDTAPWTDALLNNRVGALVHAWFAEFDRMTGKAEPVLAMLAENPLNFVLPWGTFNSREDIAGWVRSIPGKTKANAHHVQAIQYRSIENGVIEIDDTILWQSLKNDGTVVNTQARHLWLAKDGDVHQLPKVQKYYPQLLVD